MAELLCLQGGAEFSAACSEMDRAVLSLVGPGQVIVLPSAAAQGREYATAGSNALTYYSGLGADVRLAPDPREDLLGAVEAIRTAALVVLPGGSPGRLVEALVETALGAAVAAAPAISGASAGAMVLCATTVLPDVKEHPLVPGCGLVPDALVIPHFAGSLRWIDPAQHEGPRLVLGLPECSGLIITERTFTAVGTRSTTVFEDGVKRVVPVGESWQP